MHDLIIDNALLCDGTGAPLVPGSLAVRDGRIAAIGKLDGQAAHRRIDAGGQVLSPGFIDPHTHYDAQLTWDPMVTCSPLHGVTTVLIGNCGVGVAPAAPHMREQLMYDLVGVEGIAFDVMKAGIDWRWQTWGEYLDVLDASQLGINVAGLLAYTPLRHDVMGAAARERVATDDEIARMTAIFRQAMRDGAFGFSTSLSQTHAGADGRPVACRNASREELQAMARTLAEFDHGLVGLALDSAGWNLVNDKELDLLGMLARDSGKLVTCLSLLSRPGEPDFHRQTFERLATLGPEAARIVPQTSPRPIVAQCDLRSPSFLAAYPSFRAVVGQPLERQLQVYGDPAFRQAFMGELARRNRTHFVSNMLVLQVQDPALKSVEGRTVGGIAQEQGKAPVDVFFDLAIRDDLAMQFQAAAANYDLDGLERLMQDDRVLIGLSDGGAHNDMLCDAGYATAVLDIWVRQRKALTLEKAVSKMTSVPARLMGMTERGVLAEGKVADLALFDPATVTSKTPHFIADLPGGARRLVADAEGVTATVVAGHVVAERGEYTGKRAGRVLKPGAC